MTIIDRMLQRWRIRMACKHLAEGDRVLDIGCADGALFRHCPPLGEGSVGLDHDLEEQITVKGHLCMLGNFPDDVSDDAVFDAICLLAVVEHIPGSEWDGFRQAVCRCLPIGGRVVITVPSPLVDPILAVLQKMRLIDGMALEEHHGFEVKDVDRLFPSPQFRVVVRRKFQLGLNNLFVFVREA